MIVINFFLSSLKVYIKKLDWILFSLGVLSSAYGIVLIYSATRSLNNSNKFMIIQIGALLLGILAFFIIATFDFERISRFWVPIMILNLLFQASLLVFGEAGDTGNNSWIRFDFLPVGIQPGEIGKLIFICTFAKHIAVCKSRINEPLNVLALLAHGGLTMGFVYLFSKDLGMTIAYAFITAIMLLLSNMSFKWLVPMAVGALGSLPLVWKYLLKGYQKDRILVVFDPSISEQYSYHAKQSQIAMGSGGIWGSGLLQGRQTQYGLLPAKHTDFIFAVAGEELGLIGCLAIVLLLVAIVFKIFYNASKMHDDFSFLVCAGIGTMFIVQTLINIGMCVGVAPVIGLTLPFFSYGGTSLLTNFCALGIIAALLVKKRPDWIRR